MYTVNFTHITKDDVSTVGGKGANLGEMTKAGIPVPPGFVVCADAYRLFLSKNGLNRSFETLLSEAGDDETRLMEAAGKMRKLILESDFPEELADSVKESFDALSSGSEHDIRVAVRSSATAEDLPDASFAGQQETYLNVRGLEEVYAHIRKCYASLWGNRAVNYRFHQGYSQTDVALAVVIQLMVESEKAGVLFTADPVTNDQNKMQINASYGLGESVVSGRVTADSVLCTKEGTVLSYDIGSKKTQIIYDEKNTKEIKVDDEDGKRCCLNDDEILALCREGLKIETHYGHPMDIEWAIRDGKVYILQARAITTINNPMDDASEKALIEEYLKDTKVSGPAASNLAFQLEKMPYAYRAFDYDCMIQINTQKAKLLHEGGLNLSSDPGMDDDAVMTLPQSSFGINKNIFDLSKMIRTIKDFPYCEEQCKRFMPGYEKEISKLGEIDFENMPLDKCGEFIGYAYELTGRLAYDRFKYALFPSALSSHLTKAVKRIDKKYTNYDLYKGLNNKTTQISRDAAVLAGKLRSDKEMSDDILSGMNYETLKNKYPNKMGDIDAYLKENGFKSDFNCYCVIAKTLNEDPDRLLNILRPLINSENVNDTGDGSAEYEEMLSKLSSIYGKKYDSLKKDIECFRAFHMVREESQYLWESLFYYIRKALTRINLILVGNKDHISGISNLFYKELVEACKRGFLNDADKEKIQRRNEKHPFAQKVWDASKLLVFKDNGEILKGISGSTGVAFGTVCIVHSPSEFHKMKKGDILVCELTDPEWTPLFSLAGAVVADTGSSLSHAAIVAREYKIPAVLGTGYATSRFKDGDTIRVDGDKGEVSACQ